jgi:hypothetical protein
MKQLSILFVALVMSGCGILDTVNPVPSTCERYVAEACDTCNVSDSYEDTVCACIADGEVKNASDYYPDKETAEVDCENTRIRVSTNYGDSEYKNDCARRLKLLKEFEDDACEYLGLESSSSGYDYDDYYDYYDYYR